MRTMIFHKKQNRESDKHYIYMNVTFLKDTRIRDSSILSRENNNET